MTGSGKAYEHENNYVSNQPTARCTFGWYSYGFGSHLARDLMIEPIMSSLHHVRLGHVNVQEEFFAKFRKTLA